jgi:hypothetical protein
VSHEQLLHWTAEQGAGTFEAFGEAHAWATRRDPSHSMHAALGHLSALAYAEVDWRAERWSAVPPCVTLLPDAAGHGLLVGARTARLTRELLDAIPSDVYLHPVHQRRAPDAVFLAADSETALERFAASLELPYVHSVVEQLSAILPNLDAELAGHETPPVVMHYGLERFDLDAGWLIAEEDREPGLYRYERAGPRALQLLGDDGCRHDVDLAVGTWAEARRLGVTNLLWWESDGVNGTLNVPRFLPLPTLHARVAALCSGLSSRWHDGCQLYDNVPRWLAERIARALAQELVVR